MTIKDLRTKAKLTQSQAADMLGIPLRTYSRYESNADCCSDIKTKYIIDKLTDFTEITETKGILDFQTIKECLTRICQKYEIGYCCLFGSYARGTQNETSDVDVLIDSSISGFEFYGLVEEIRTGLSKKVDLLRLEDVMQNKELLLNILKEGIRVYG